MILKKIAVISMLLVSFCTSANDGVWVDATRVIYNENDLSKSLTVNNASELRPYLIRSWIENEKGELNNWVVTPPVYRLKGKGSIQLRLTAIKTEHLSKNEESVFYINILAIPGTESEKNNNDDSKISGSMNLAINTKLKVFYRPLSLNDVNINEEYKRLKFKSDVKGIVIVNPTPFHVNFSELKVGGELVKIGNVMIKPFSSFTVNTRNNTGAINYTIINDFGGPIQFNNVNIER